MDASDGGNRNGNGNADPAPVSLPSDAVAPTGAPVSPSPAVEVPAGAPEPLVVVDQDDARDPKTGRIKKGKTLNKSGRSPGAPSINFELIKAVKKYKLGSKGYLELLLTKSLQDVEYAKLLVPRILANVDQPAAAGGLTINNSPQVSASSSVRHDRFEELRDPGVRDAFCDLADRIAERRRNSVAPGNGSN